MTSTPLAGALLVLVLFVAAACDDEKKPASSGSPGASAAAATSAAPPSAPPPPVAESASAAPPGAAMVTGDAKDVVLTMKDPAKEPEHTIKVAAGGSLTLFLPDYPGTVWSVETADKTLGKAKEEVIPGFAPGTNGHQFKWSLAAPSTKVGAKHKVVLGNKKVGDKAAKADKTFTLTIEVA